MVSIISGRGRRVTMAIVLTLSMIFLAFPVGQASAVDMLHQVTNVGDKSFTVTWLTDTAEAGYVKYGTSAGSLDNTAYDDRGQATEDDTHHVTITGLSEGSLCYYEIVSGGVTYNNGGAPYEITTGPTLQPQMPEMVSGTVYKTDGVTAAEGAIVYASIGTSQVLSVLVDSSGAWAMNIASIRGGDYQSYYTHSDSDDISLDAEGGADGTDSQTVTIATAKAGAPAMELTSGPAADFSAITTAADVGEAIQFTDATSGGVTPYSYEWDFGDGQNSTEANPSHAYSAAGTYTVSLTVTDSQSRADTETKTDYITVAEVLVTDFSADTTAADVGEAIQFTDATSGGVTPYSYEWDFGDGQNSTEANPSHAYTTAGTYTVSLTVTDSQSRVDTETKTDYITALAVDMLHQVTNVGDKSFTVTWLTDTAEAGYVKYGTSAGSLDNTAYDDRGQATEDDTHHVTITGLSAGSPCYYEIVSGGVTYNNGGAPYEITTGPTLQPQMPEMISGTVYKTDGVTAAEGVIVYASIGTSQVLSALADSGGVWGLDIAPIRTADYQSYYDYAGGDQALLVVEGAGDGRATHTITVDELKAETVAITVCSSVTVQFNPGLNLWALADVPATDYTASTLAASINKQGGTVTKIYRWDTGIWEAYRVDFSANDFPIEPGRGYFILCSGSSTWNMLVKP